LRLISTVYNTDAVLIFRYTLPQR